MDINIYPLTMECNAPLSMFIWKGRNIKWQYYYYYIIIIYMTLFTHRIFARILITPVQNSNSNISARPVSATQLLIIIYSTSLLCRSRQLTLQHCLKDKLLEKKLADYPQVKIENASCKFLPVAKIRFSGNCFFNRPVKRVQAKSLASSLYSR